MTADLLALLDTDPAAGFRGVAALMRARGEGARFWSPSSNHDGMDEDPWYSADELTSAHSLRVSEHIAAADPPFVLAVSDWLDECALLWELGVDEIGPLVWKQAIATARAYLGRDT